MTTEGILSRLAVQPRSATSVEVARHLLTYLLSGEVAPGSKIPSERALAAAMNVGRSAVREALKAHTVLGLLEVRQGDGTYLAASSSDLLPDTVEWGLLLGERRTDELVEARAEVETSLAGMAGARRSDEDLASLEAAYARMEACGDDLEAYVRADVDFHLCLARAAGNTVLAGFLGNVRSLLSAWTRQVILNLGETQVSLELHHDILRAVAARDSGEARVAMGRHMTIASHELRVALGDARTSDGNARGEPVSDA